MATFIKGDPAAPEPDDGTTVVYDRVNKTYVPGPTPGGGGVTVHGDLTGRSVVNQHPVGAITGLQSALDSKVAHDDPRLSDPRDPIKHDHSISDVTGLPTALANKSDVGHVHDDRYYTQSEVDAEILANMVPVELGTRNLDTVQVSGTYIQMSSSNATTTRNYPPGVTDAFSSAGTLVVWGRGGLVFQMYVLGGEFLWVRRRNAAGTWIAWTTFTTPQQVDAALDEKANATHQHPVTDLETTGTRDATTYLRGDGAWATPEGGGGGGGLRFIKPAVTHYFSSPLLYGGVDDKPKGHIGPSYYPGYATPLTVNEVSIWVNVAGSSGHTAEVVVYEATEDGFPGAAISTTTHDVSSTGRKGVSITPFVWPEHGVWTMVNLSESGARLRVAGFAPLGTSGSGQGSAAAFSLTQRAVIDPNNSSAGDNPGIVAFRRSA